MHRSSIRLWGIPQWLECFKEIKMCLIFRTIFGLKNSFLILFQIIARINKSNKTDIQQRDKNRKFGIDSSGNPWTGQIQIEKNSGWAEKFRFNQCSKCSKWKTNFQNCKCQHQKPSFFKSKCQGWKYCFRQWEF